MLRFIHCLPALLFLASNLQYSDGAIAAMSVDLGSQYMKLGVVKIGIPLEIVLNKESQRKTATLIAFHNGERLFGETALQMSYKNPERVISFATDLLGKQFDNPVVQDYIKQFPYLNLTADPDRGTVIFNTQHDGSYSVETIVGMILWNAREQTSAFSKSPLKDVVITCPSYYNQAEREALASAADIAGLNLLQLISDGAASGVNYAFTRRKDITKEPQTLLIYDIGASKTVATVVELKLGNANKSSTTDPIVTVLGVGFNRLLGGHDLTLRVRDYLAGEFTKQHKTSKPIYGNLRALSKLTKEAERVKHVLSANAQTYAQVESLFEDKDFRVLMTRETLSGILAEYEKDYLIPVDDALRMAETNVDSVTQIVLFGAGTRIPRIQDLLRERFNGKEPSRFLNTDESAALGALYQAAHLSKGFKVKKIVVQELQLYPVNINFETLTEDQTRRTVDRNIFGYKSLYPTNRKIMTFTSYEADFIVNLHYGSLKHLSEDQLIQFGDSNITDVYVQSVTEAVSKAKEEGVDFKGIKVYFLIDYFGIIRTEGAEAIIEKHPVKANSTLGAVFDTIGSLFTSKEPEPSEGIKDDTEMPKPPDSKSGDEEETPEQQFEEPVEKPKENKTEETEQPTVDPANATNTTVNGTESVNATDAKPKVIKKKLDISLYQLHPTLDETHIKESKKVLSQYEKQERQKAEREAAHNELEAKVYDIRDRLNHDDFLKFTRGEESAKLGELVAEVATWLDDDVDLETKTEDFVEKRTAIDVIFKPIVKRIKDFDQRPKLVERFNTAFDKLKELVTKLKTDIPDLFEPSFYKKSEEMTEELIEFLKKRLPEGKAADDDDTINDDLRKKIKDLERISSNLFNEFSRKVKELTAKKAAEDAAAAKAAKKNATVEATPEGPADEAADVPKADSQESEDAEKPVDTPKKPTIDLNDSVEEAEVPVGDTDTKNKDPEDVHDEM